MNRLTVFKKLSENLGHRIDCMQDLQALTLFMCLSGWVLAQGKALSTDLFHRYSIVQLASFEPQFYAIEYSEIDVPTEIRILKRFIKEILPMRKFDPKQEEHLTVQIRDLLWALVCFKSKQICPQCNDDELRCLWSAEDKQIVLSCDICCWAQYQNGNKWSGVSNLVPADREILHKLGYI